MRGAANRDMEGGGRALLSLLPVLSSKTDVVALAAAERLLLMLLSSRDMAAFRRHATECQDTLQAHMPTNLLGWEQVRALHATGALLDPTGGETVEEDVVQAQGGGMKEGRREKEPRKEGAHGPSADPGGAEGACSLGELAVAASEESAEALLPQAMPSILSDLETDTTIQYTE